MTAPDPSHNRYHRQMLLPDVGTAGQARLGGAHAAIVGCGALGGAVADHLARAGVGTLTLLDRDTVDWTNLNRQTLYTEEDARRAVPKADAAKDRLAHVNSGTVVRALVADLRPESAERVLLAPRPDVLIDGTDNFETRYLLNDLAVKHAIPLVYGGVVATRGMAITIIPPGARVGDRVAEATACLRCAFEDPPVPGSQPTCDTAGVLGPVVAIVAAVQATEALKILLGRGDLVSRTLLDMDPWQGQRRRLALAPSGECPCCAGRRFEFLDAPAADAAALCGQDAVQVAAAPGTRVDLPALARRLGSHGSFVAIGQSMIRGVLTSEAGDVAGTGITLSVFADGRAIVKGTTSLARARTVYARYVGG